MSQEENKSNNFQKLLQLRGVFKRVSQVTWSAKQAEDRWIFGNPENERLLLETYLTLLQEIKDSISSLSSLENKETLTHKIERENFK